MAYHRFFRALDRVESILSGSRRGGWPVPMLSTALKPTLQLTPEFDLNLNLGLAVPTLMLTLDPTCIDPDVDHDPRHCVRNSISRHRLDLQMCGEIIRLGQMVCTPCRLRLCKPAQTTRQGTVAATDSHAV